MKRKRQEKRKRYLKRERERSDEKVEGRIKLVVVTKGVIGVTQVLK